MILGHWYLVTPKLPEGPLILIARALFVVVALQLLLFAVGRDRGGPGRGSAVRRARRTVGALRLDATDRRPRVPAVRVLRRDPDRRTRSMESATGLLINVGSIAAGTILAAGLYFGAGLLV